MYEDQLQPPAGEVSAPAHRTGTAAPADETPVEPLLNHGVRVLRRRYKIAVLAFVLFTVPTVAFIMRKPLRYQATARILVERSEEVSSLIPESREPDAGAGDLRTQLQLLRSRPVVVKAISRIRLWEAQEYATPLTDVTEAKVSASGLVDAFLGKLTITPAPGTRVLNVTFEAADPDVAMRAANALVQTHIDEQTKAQFASSAEVVRWLKERLAEQQRQLAASEAALQTYMEGQNAVSLQDRQNIVVQKLGDLNGAVTRAKTDRIARQTLYNQLRAAQDSRASLDSLPVVLTNSILQQIRAQLGELKQRELLLVQDLGDKHPDLVKLRSEIEQTDARLGAELAKVVDSVKNEFTAAEALEKSLLSALETQTQEVLGLNRQSLEYGELARQAVSDRQLYERLLNEAQTRGITGKTQETRIRIIEAAERPRVPVGPQRTRELLLALCGGLLLAIGVPLIRESLDHHVKTPGDIERHLGLRCLAMVPDVGSKSPGAPPLFANDATPFSEAFRRIRTAIVLASPERGVTRLVVTSAVPREGKTVVSVNLAMALAQMNQRILLIDGDLRRPKVHKLLGVSPFPGLTDLLDGKAAFDEAVRGTRKANLFVLPCGTKHPAASELLSSPQLARLFDHLEESFDWIVVDSPPVGPVADACVIGQRVHHAVVVIGADSTTLSAVRAAAGQLESAGVAITGAILNRADLQHAGYYYAPYYSGEYDTYYSAPAARTPRKQPKIRESNDSVEPAPTTTY